MLGEEVKVLEALTVDYCTTSKPMQLRKVADARLAHAPDITRKTF